MQPIVAFVSDFGLDDAWVGVCHAVIRSACPRAAVVDLSHNVPPFDITKGAVVAAAGVWQLPRAIHLVVVDPTVGGGRHDLCVVSGEGTTLVGPDNGILIPATWRSGGVREAFAIAPEILGPKPPQPTFHARDVLAPAAAALACGVEPRSLGPELDPATLAPAPFARPRVEGAYLVSEVVDIDRFGSLRLSLGAEELQGVAAGSASLGIVLGHLTVDVPFAHTFADVDRGQPVAMIDSSGWLSVAVRQGSAAERYGVEPGATVKVRLPD